MPLTHITSVPCSGLPEPKMAGTQTHTREFTSTQTTRHLRRCLSSGVKGKKRLVQVVLRPVRADSHHHSVEQSNIAIVAVSVTICVLRWLLMRCQYRLGCIELLYDLFLGILWFAALSGQSASDLSDHDHLSTTPWYLRKGCGAVPPPATNACALMQAQWAVSISML